MRSVGSGLIVAAVYGLLAAIGIWLASSVSGCSTMTPADIRVIAGVPSPELAEAETKDALAFYCGARKLPCDTFQWGLTIIVVSDPLPIEGGKWAAGLYNPLYETIFVVWLNGPGFNSTFHELLHHERYLYHGEFDFGLTAAEVMHHEHTSKFLNIVTDLQAGWLAGDTE